MSPWVAVTPFAALTMAPLPILLGWLAARRRILDEPWRHRTLLRRVAVGGVAIGWLGGLPEALAVAGVLPLPARTEGIVRATNTQTGYARGAGSVAPWVLTALTSLTGVACGAGYAAAFGLLALRLEGRRAEPDAAGSPAPSREAERAFTPAQRSIGVAPTAEVPPRRTEPGTVERMLAAVGRRSLTFYLFQSVLLAPLMAAWGLGLGGTLSTAPAVAVAFAVWLVSLPIALVMERRGWRGPAEALLRRLTYGRGVASPGAARS